MAFLSSDAYVTLLEHRGRANGNAGRAWVSGLETLIPELLERWRLTPAGQFENLSYNYVAPVTRDDGTPAVLKLNFPDHDFLCEAEATRTFDGQACARLIGVDREDGAMLLERALPGNELHTLGDDVAETAALADVIRDLQRPYAGIFPFPYATEWIDEALDPNAIPGLKASYPWIQRALDRLVDIASEPFDAVLLHGDLHHDNVLSATRAPWLAIDPKGVIGDPVWEIAPFLFNRLDRYPRADWPATIRRRAEQLSEELELDRERVYAWSAVRAIQSAYWSLKDEPSNDGPVHDGAIVCAQALADA